jgi:hypothetical protein
MNHKLANGMKVWKGKGNTTTLLFYPKELEILHKEKRGQVNTIVMEHFNGILSHKSGPPDNQHTNLLTSDFLIMRPNSHYIKHRSTLLPRTNKLKGFQQILIEIRFIKSFLGNGQLNKIYSIFNHLFKISIQLKEVILLIIIKIIFIRYSYFCLQDIAVWFKAILYEECRIWYSFDKRLRRILG